MEITGCRKNKSEAVKESSPLPYFPGSISRVHKSGWIVLFHLNRKDVAFHKAFKSTLKNTVSEHEIENR